MRAFASLHTQAPSDQADHEVSYEGYERVEVEFDEGFGNTPVQIHFPVILADSADIIHYVAIGTHAQGPGEIFLRVSTLPMHLKAESERLTREFWIALGAPPDQIDQLIAEYGRVTPTVCVANTNAADLPANLNPIARVAHQLVYAGLMNAADLHPKLYEAINDALHNAGVPVIPVVRSGAAHMKPAAGLGITVNHLLN